MRCFRTTLLLLILLTGCANGGSPAPAEPVPAQQQAPAPPEPVGPLTVTREGDKVIVEGLKNWTVFPATDGSAFAFEAADGIWSLDPKGGNLRQWIKGDGFRTTLDLNRDRLLYLERQGDQLLILKAEPGKEPGQLAAVDVRHIYQEGRIPAWSRLKGDRLTLAVLNTPLMQVDLATGAVGRLGTEPMTVLLDILMPMQDGRYLLQKGERDHKPIRIYDLEAGTVFQPEGEDHGYPQRSPTADRYAVLAAAEDSGLAVEHTTGRLEAGGTPLEVGTHVDVGEPNGTVRHLHPPDASTLARTPYWSPDGTKLAIQSNVSPDSVWIVDVAAGKWTPLTRPVDGLLTGWLDDGHLRLDGPGYQRNRLLVTGGAPEPVPLVNGQVTLGDGTLFYRPHDDTGGDSVWVKRPGQQTGVKVLGGDGTYAPLVPVGDSVVVVNQTVGGYKLIIPE